jgi:hypothetical protein
MQLQQEPRSVSQQQLQQVPPALSHQQATPWASFALK